MPLSLGCLLASVCSALLDPGSSLHLGAGAVGPPYHYPNHSEHQVTVGAYAYPRGPAIWDYSLTSKQPFGGWGLSAGWTWNVAPKDSLGRCPPIPDDAWGLGLDSKRLWVSHHEPTGGCFIGCNITDIVNGATDPCNGGAIYLKTPRFGKVIANYSCFWGGAKFLKDPSVGICGFNCTAFDIYNKTPCNIWEANGENPVCNIECDPRKF